MKKYLIVLAAAVVALASCTTESKYTSIRFKNANIDLEEGTTSKLQILYEPTTLEAPVCEWSSSNPSIVKVDQNGNVEALAIGEANVTAKVEDLEAVCHITVKSYMDMVNWAGWTIWNLDKETVLTDTFDVELSDGWYKCVMVPATAFVWDDGIMPTYDGQYMDGLTGEGFVLEVIDMPVYVIAAGDYEGYYVGSSYLGIVDSEEFNPNDTAFAYCAAAGKLGDAQKFYTYLSDTAAHVDYTECLTGTELSYINWDTQRGYYWFGLAGTGFFYGDEESVYYKQNVNWFEYRYGLAVVENEEGELDFKEPAEWGNIIEKYYENLPEQSTKKLTKPMKPAQNNKPIIKRERGVNMGTKVFMHK